MGGAPSTAQPCSYKIIGSASGSYNATYAIGYNRYAVVIAAIKAGSGTPPIDADGAFLTRTRAVRAAAPSLGALDAAAALL